VPPYVILAALAVCLSVPVLWLALAGDRVPSRDISRNLTVGLPQSASLRGMVLSRSATQRVLGPAARAVAGRARRLSPNGMLTGLERRIELAAGGWPVEKVLLTKVALGGGLLAVGLVRALSSPSGASVLVAFLACAAGYVAPDAVLSRRATARQLAIANELADTLDQLTVCVEAGLGFDAALARTSRSGSGPLAHEISRMLQELRVGVPRAEALENLVGRNDVPELRQFVHAVIQAESYGVPVARVLRAQAAEQREKRRFRAEERAMKLPVKVVFPLVVCILPVMFIVIFGPAALNIAHGMG
jgi:tight adherence protein C